MILFNKGNVSPPIPEVTNGVAQTIYNLFAAGLDDTQIHKKGYQPVYIGVVRGEILSLEKKIIQAMQADEVPKTINELKAELYSDLLNVDKVVNDMLIYYPKYDPSRTWQKFFEVFVPPESEPIEGEGEGI